MAERLLRSIDLRALIGHQADLILALDRLPLIYPLVMFRAGLIFGLDCPMRDQNAVPCQTFRWGNGGFWQFIILDGGAPKAPEL